MTRPKLPQNSHRATLEWASDSELKIIWEDGHESAYSLRYLRKACPCARCKAWPKRDEDGFPLLPPSRLENVRATAVHPVGRYAVQFVWSDGHRTGYYPYGYLRRICPCEECRKQRG